MNFFRRSLIQRMEHARDFELAVRSAYLDLAAHADASPIFHHSLVCHGERSVVQAARIGRALALALGEVRVDDDAAEPRQTTNLPRPRLPQDALELAEREIAMYRDCLRLAHQAGEQTLARLCEDLLEEEVAFQAAVSRVLEREAMAERREAMAERREPILSLAAGEPAIFAPPVKDDMRLRVDAA